LQLLFRLAATAKMPAGAAAVRRSIMARNRRSKASVSLGPKNEDATWDDVLDELALPEEREYPPISMLRHDEPPAMVKGPSGWIYHSTSLGCLLPYHCPRRIAIHMVESPVFDPIILLTIICNCATMAWASPMDEGGDWKEDFLAVRTRRRARKRPRPVRRVASVPPAHSPPRAPPPSLLMFFSCALRTRAIIPPPFRECTPRS
jgi:hypothetical protein